MGDGVLELRLVVTAPDYDEALRFYRDVLGLPEVAAFDDGAGRVAILDAGRATLELSDVPHAEHIDRLEVGRRVAGQIRVAFQVPDALEATNRLLAGGATLVAAPVETSVEVAQLAARGAGRAPAHPVPAARAGMTAVRALLIGLAVLALAGCAAERRVLSTHDIGIDVTVDDRTGWAVGASMVEPAPAVDLGRLERPVGPGPQSR